MSGQSFRGAGGAGVVEAPAYVPAEAAIRDAQPNARFRADRCTELAHPTLLLSERCDEWASRPELAAHPPMNVSAP